MLQLKKIQRTAWSFISSVLIALSAIVPLFTGQALAAGLAIDKQASAHTSSGSSITSSAFTTTQANELIVAFISTDGPNRSAQTVTSVSGGGLTWRMRQLSNSQPGPSEIWTAAAPSILTNTTVKATLNSSYAALMTVVAFTGADTSATAGATAGGNATTGAPSISLTTTKAGSWTWGVGNDWDRAVSRTVGANQTKVDEYLPSVGDTYWVQRLTSPTAAAGTAVTLNDTAPINDHWNFAALEIVPATVDTIPPSVPQNVTANATSSSQINLNWSASTDDSGLAPRYTVLRNGSQIATNVIATNYSDIGLAASTSYNYTVRAYDGGGNVSAESAVAIANTGTPDTTPPTVAMTNPADGTTVSSTVTLSATASDNVAVKNVQFQLTNMQTNIVTNIGSALTSAPYQTTWNSGTVPNGQYALSAMASDTAGNTTTATRVTVTVSNTAPVVPVLDPSTPAPVGVPRNVSSMTTAAFSPPAGTVIYAALSLDQLPGEKTVVGSITNTGTPLNWQLLGRENHGNGGDVEVWWAYNVGAQSNMTVTTNFSQPSKDVPAPLGDFQVFVFNNAAPNQAPAATAINWLTDGTGSNTPNVTITPTTLNSRMFAIFDNWNYDGSSIVPGTDQSIISEVLNSVDVDSYWIQQKNTPTSAPGTPILMNATLGGVNEWHAMAWEVLPLSS